MNVIVYVEGPSDQLAMQELLVDLLSQLEEKGMIVKFIPSGNKKNLMLKTPTKAANILLNQPHSMVIALPDLYPLPIGKKKKGDEGGIRIQLETLVQL